MSRRPGTGTSGRRKRVRAYRETLYVAQSGCCMYCGEWRRLNHLTLDHVVPKSAGGGTTWSNLVMACKACNNAKSDTALAEWLAYQPWVDVPLRHPITGVVFYVPELVAA